MTRPPLARGDLIVAPFPRMMGKRRPGVVIFVDGAVVATPLTTSKRGVGLRIPLDGVPGLVAPSFALPLMTAALPPGVVEPTEKTAPEALLETLEARLRQAFGPRWRVTNPPIKEARTSARLLHRVKRRR